MQKIFLIIKREYLTRVRKKTFIISTILFPLLYLGIIFGMAYLGEKGKARLNVAVLDFSGYFDKGKMERANQKDSSTVLSLVNISQDSLSSSFKNMGYDGYVVIPQQVNWQEGLSALSLKADRTLSMGSVSQVEGKLNSIWSEVKNEKLGIDDETRSILQASRVSLRPTNINDETADSGVASTIGYVAGFLIYFILLI